MQHESFVCRCVVVAVLAACNTCVLAKSDAAKANGVTVILTVTHKTVLLDEYVRFTVELHNNSTSKLRYLPDGYSLDSMQVFIRMERGDKKFNDKIFGHSHGAGGVRHNRGDRVPKIERDCDWSAVETDATAVLRPGESCRWDDRRLRPEWFFITGGNPKSMQAQVLIGPRRWVSSNKVKFSAVNKKFADFPALFSGKAYISWGTWKYPVSFHRVKIKEEEYLFRGRLRACRIPKGADISIEFRPRANVGIVRFDTETTSSVVYVSGDGVLDSQGLVAFCRKKLEAKPLSKFPELKVSLLDILAGHGEPGSIKLFDEYSGGNNLLVKHRNNYECVRLLLSRATGMKNAADAHKLVMQCLFAKEYKPAKGPAIALGKIAPKGTEAKKFSELLKGFVKDHGKIPLTKDDVLGIEELAAETEKAAKG